MFSNRHVLRWSAPAALALIWVAEICVAFPIGEFPIIDDWSYAQSVWWTVEAGALRLHDFTSMPLLTHVAMGSAWTVAFGKSFTALRALTLCTGLAGILALFCLSRTLGASRRTAFVAALTFALNPMYLVLSCSFMTDVAFITLGLTASALFVGGFNSEQRLHRNMLIGLAFAVALAATFERQVGLALPISFGVALALRDVGPRWRRAGYFLPAFATLMCLTLYERWLSAGPGLPVEYHVPVAKIRVALGYGFAGFATHVLGNLTESLLLIGLFAIPIVALISVNRELWQPKALWAVMSVIIAVRCAEFGVQAAFYAETFFDLGVGVIAMYKWQTILEPTLWWPIMLFVTAACIYSVGALVALGLTHRAQLLVNPLALGGVSLLLLSLAPTLAGELHDRYLLFPIAVVLVMCAVSLRNVEVSRVATPVTAVLLAGLFWFSAAGVHDLFAMNRVRWAILNGLMDSGVEPSKIDGGFEFNGLHTFHQGSALKFGLTGGKSPYWIVDDEWAVSLAPDDDRGYVVVETHDVDLWLSDDLGPLYLLRRFEPQAMLIPSSAGSGSPAGVPDEAVVPFRTGSEGGS